MIRKLLQTIHANLTIEERHAMLVDMERACLTDNMEKAGNIACYMIARGEFNHLAEIFKKNKNYKP